NYHKVRLPADHAGRFLPDAGRVLVTRAIQRARQDKAKDALDDLATVFSLSHHLWHEVPPQDFLMSEGMRVQAAALLGLERWTREAQPSRPLLERALEILRKQDQLQPTTSRLRQAGLFAAQSHPPAHPLVAVALRPPWENER